MHMYVRRCTYEHMMHYIFAWCSYPLDAGVSLQVTR